MRRTPGLDSVPLAGAPEEFFVNGKKTLLRGACVHHDNGILGACSFEDAEFRRVRLLKEAGFNAIRSPTTLPPRRCWMPVTGWVCMSWMNSATTGWYIKTLRLCGPGLPRMVAAGSHSYGHQKLQSSQCGHELYRK